MTDNAQDFYEDDEPAEKVHAAFERGTKGLTGRIEGPSDLSSFTVDGVKFEGEAQRFRLEVKAPITTPGVFPNTRALLAALALGLVVWLLILAAWLVIR